MLTKLQAYIVGGCLLVSVLFVVIFEAGFFLSASRSPQVGLAGQSSERANVTGLAGKSDSARTGASQEVPLPDAHFKLRVERHNTAKGPQGEQKMDADMELTYGHEAAPGGILVTFYSLEMKSLRDGRVDERFFMSHDKFVEQTGSQVRELSRMEVSPEQREKMEAAFATYHTKILLDEDLNETGREPLSRLGWRVVNEGLLNTTRLVHGPYYRGTNSWTSSPRIPMTMGLILDCPVQYTKADSGGLKVRVAGSLSQKEVHSSTSDVSVRDVSIRLSGEEFFDRDVGDYTAGKLELSYGFEVIEKGQSAATLRGEMTISLERVVAKN